MKNVQSGTKDEYVHHTTYDARIELNNYVSKFKNDKRDSKIESILNNSLYELFNIEDDPEYNRLLEILKYSGATSGNSGYTGSTGSVGTTGISAYKSKSKSKYHA